MNFKKTVGEKIFDVSNILVLIALCIVTLYPLLYVAFASLSEPSRIVQHSGLLLSPLGISLQSYKAVFENPMIALGYANTIYYVVAGTTINIVLTSMGAYCLSRKKVLWNKFVTGLILFTMFFNGGLIPTYLLVKGLGMTNTRWAMIIPSAISVWNLVVMRTSFASIPESLEESARIDGANDFTILFKIIMPLSMPIIMVMVLYYGVGHWNSWFNAMIYLNKSRELYPLQMIIREILLKNDTNGMIGGGASDIDRDSISETIKYATIMVATLPILTVYPFIQKYFVKGVMIGSVKG